MQGQSLCLLVCDWCLCAISVCFSVCGKGYYGEGWHCRRIEVRSRFCHNILSSHPAKTLHGNDRPPTVTFLEGLLRIKKKKNLKSSGAIICYLPAAVTNTKCVKLMCKLGVPVFLFNWAIIESAESFGTTFSEGLSVPSFIFVHFLCFWSSKVI